MSERACSGASGLWLVTGSCALFRGRGSEDARQFAEFSAVNYMTGCLTRPPHINSPTAGRYMSAQYVNYNYRQEEYPCIHTRTSIHLRANEKPPPSSQSISFLFLFHHAVLGFRGAEEELLHIVPPLFPSPHLRHLSAHFIVVESCAASREMHSFVIGLWPSANSRSPLTL